MIVKCPLLGGGVKVLVESSVNYECFILVHAPFLRHCDRNLAGPPVVYSEVETDETTLVETKISTSDY